MQVDLPKLEHSNQTGAVFAVFVSQGERNAEGYAQAMAQGRTKLGAINTMAVDHDRRIEIARSARDLSRIRGAGRQTRTR